MKSLKFTATIATLAIGLIAQPAQAQSYEEFGERVSTSTVTLLKGGKHNRAAENWLSSDYAPLTEDARFLQDGIDRAIRQCKRYKAQGVVFSAAQYNKLTFEIFARETRGVPTFAPSAKDQDKAQVAAIAVALAYESEKHVCPTIVWRSR